MTDEMTEERLAEIRQRAEAATEGPWYWRNTQEVYLLGERARAVMTFRRMGMQGAQPEFRNADGLLDPAGRENLYGYPDAAFIAHARQDIPDLLDEVERLRNIEMDYCSIQQTAAALDEEIERLRGRNADLATRLDMAVHELEEHVAPERARLREQVETLQAERDAMTVWYRVWLRGGGIYYAENERDARECLSSTGGYLESRLCSTWLPVAEEGPTP